VFVKSVTFCNPQELPVAIGVDPQLKVLMRSLQKVPHSRPEFGPHLYAIQSEQLPLLFRQPHCVICQVRPQQSLVLRLNLTEAS